MTRQLATIQKIAKLEPIEGADRIEVATVLGWHVVVKKGEFEVGDLCIYFEVDSLLPILPIFSFFKESDKKTILGEDQKEHTGYRLKTIRLRKQISQGLALPVSGNILPEGPYSEGKDVTDILGVVKYERYVRQSQGSGVLIVFPGWMPKPVGSFIRKYLPWFAKKFWRSSLKPFPSFIPKTDETRLQSVPKVLYRQKAEKFYVTEKLDGSSITVFCQRGKVEVCSRNVWQPKDYESKYWKPIVHLDLQNKMKTYENIALQGELVGEGVQGNKLKIKDLKVYFFGAFNIKTGKHLDYDCFIRICQDLGVEVVPVIDYDFKLKRRVDKMVEFATRKSLLNPEVWAEGIVVRSVKERQDKQLGRLSFKVINPEFLLAYGE